jgi:hypothetical protein
MPRAWIGVCNGGSPRRVFSRKHTFFLWLQFVVEQLLVGLHRHHLRSGIRDARLEVSMNAVYLSESQFSEFAARIIGREISFQRTLNSRSRYEDPSAEIRTRIVAAFRPFARIGLPCGGPVRIQ